MADIKDGEIVEMQGSGKKPYILKNVGGVYSCSCPAWRNQSVPIDRRSCKHLRKLRGDAAEEARLGSPLPEQAPEKLKKETAPPVLLANNWTEDVDPKGFYMSEKLDGVRAWWDGAKFLSRDGNVYPAPTFFTENLPKIPLDGELWLGRKQFSRCISIVRRLDGGKEWEKITYMVFDAPLVPGPFKERLQKLEGLFVDKVVPYTALVEQKLCFGRKDLKRELESVEELGGEGVMLRDPDSFYEAGRSNTLLKVKNFLDAEAEVIGYKPGTGKHKGRMGAIYARFPNGAEFKVGTGFSDAERENPPPIGSVITVKYQELEESGAPRFPSFLRVCEK